MSKSTISFLSFIILVLIIFVSSSVFANLGKDDDITPFAVDNNTQTKNINTNTSTSASTSASTNNTNALPVGITIAEVQKHNNASDCWTVVSAGVYDLTSFVSKHPGGSGAIIGLCGVDGTSAFVDQHGNQRRPNNELIGLKVGNLSK